MAYPCEIRQQPAQPALTIRFTAPVQDLAQHFGRVYGAIMGCLAEQGEQPAGMPFAAYYNMDMQNLDVEAGFPVSRPLPGRDEVKAGQLPGGTVAVCHYTGPYDGIAAAYDQLTDWIRAQGYEASGIVYEFYLNGPDLPPQELKTDVVAPVTPAKEKAIP